MTRTEILPSRSDPVAASEAPTAPELQAPAIAPNGSAPTLPASASGSSFDVSGLRGLADLVGWVVAPTSLVTGVLYYAGRLRSEGYWNFFGVDQALLEMSTTDYMVRSVDTIFPLALAVAVSVLVGHRLHLAVRHRLFVSERVWCLQALRVGLFVGAVLCLAVTAANLFPAALGPLDPAGIGATAPDLLPILAMVGTAALGYAIYLSGPRSIDAGGYIRLPRPSAPVLFPLCFLMILWLFWEAELWAYARGEEEAQTTDPISSVVVYSPAPLQLEGLRVAPHRFEAEPADGSAQSALAPGTGGYRYRYGGLSLLRYSKGNYFLLIEGDDRVVVLRASPELRFEFKPVGPPIGGSSPGTGGSVNVHLE